MGVSHLSLFKIALLASFPSALTCHYLIALILWYKNLDLLIVALSLSAYLVGFTLGFIYVYRSSSTLSRVAGILLSSQVVATIALAGFGYDYPAIFFAALVGVTSGGLLSLPASRMITPARASLLSVFPLVGGALIATFGEDSPLVMSSLIALIGALILFASLKIVVPKPVSSQKLSLRVPAKYALLALGTALGGSVGTALAPIVAVTQYEVGPLFVGGLITASLVISNIIGGMLISQKVLHKTMVTTVGFSLFLALFLLAIADTSLVFLLLWLVALIDLSAYNAFIMATVRSLKQCDEQNFSLLSSVVSAAGPIVAVVIWAAGSFQTMFSFSALLMLISVFALRTMLKGERQDGKSRPLPGSKDIGNTAPRPQ